MEKYDPDCSLPSTLLITLNKEEQNSRLQQDYNIVTNLSRKQSSLEEQSICIVNLEVRCTVVLRKTSK